ARRKNIAEHAEQAQVSKRLPTMRRDPALDCDPPAPLLSPPHPPKLKEMFRTFEFRNLLNRVDELDATVPAAELVVEGVSVPWREGLPVVEGRVGIAAEADRVAIAIPDEVVVADRPARLEGDLVAHDAK